MKFAWAHFFEEPSGFSFARFVSDFETEGIHIANRL